MRRTALLALLAALSGCPREMLVGVEVADAGAADAAPADTGSVCTPQCADRRCGPDGCGGECGVCSEGESCVPDGDGMGCVADCMPESDEELCAELEKQCGFLVETDRCGEQRPIQCGTCSPPATCNQLTNLCEEPACEAESDADFCERHGRQCGPFEGPDNCGALRSLPECGGCPGPADVCDATGQCILCTPETDAQLCKRLNRKCGPLLAEDNCQVPRSVESCGTCSGKKCTDDGWCLAEGMPRNDECEGAEIITFDDTGRAEVRGRIGPATNGGQSQSCIGGGRDLVYQFTLAAPALFKAVIDTDSGSVLSNDTCADALPIALDESGRGQVTGNSTAARADAVTGCYSGSDCVDIVSKLETAAPGAPQGDGDARGVGDEGLRRRSPPLRRQGVRARLRQVPRRWPSHAVLRRAHRRGGELPLDRHLFREGPGDGGRGAHPAAGGAERHLRPGRAAGVRRRRSTPRWAPASPPLPAIASIASPPPR